MRICGLFALLLLVLASAGCCTVVAKSGDAKIVKCPQIIHSRGRKMVRMELPPVSLAQVGTHVLQVRDLPPYLNGLFTYSLSMSGPYEGPGPHLSDKNAPWHDAKISVAFRKLDRSVVFEQPFLLGTTTHGFGPGRDGWEAGWTIGGLDQVPVKDGSFDIVVTIEQPSRRVSDQISISAYAVYYTQKP
ncbi:MAG: hypothetical protein NT154_39490 [Verrucomicrobia bacterium]|nr:hypothetical protein [Verrucomicrobiota bacterium]